MYWVILSLVSLFDYWTWFILSWVPFYAYFRFIVLLYLVLPQTQGAKTIYQRYVHPFLAHHEHDIDKFISSTHDKALSAGLAYLKRLIEYVKENVFGMQHKSLPPSAFDAEGNYAQNLLSRFNLPSARQGLAAPAGDLYSFLSSAMGGIASSGSASREAQVDTLSRSGTLIPRGITSKAEQRSYLNQQKEQLMVVVAALDKQNSDLATEESIERDVDKRLAGGQLGEGLKKSKSEAEFEEIASDEPSSQQARAKSGTWNPLSWISGGAAKASGVDTSFGT